MPLSRRIEQEMGRLTELGSCGFAIAFHVRFTTASFQLQTYPTAWLEVYSKEGLVMQDPIVAFGFSDEIGVRRWSDLPGADGSPVLGRAAEHGLNHGAAVVVATGDSRTVAGIARSDREYSDEELAELEEIIARLHEITSEDGEMSDAARDELRRISIEQNHPHSG